VVAPALEYLSEEPFDAATGAGNGGVEEDESRLLCVNSRGGYGGPPECGGKCDDPYPKDPSV